MGKLHEFDEGRYEMKANTRLFGEIDIPDEKIITFEQGLMGFENCKKFTIIYDTSKGEESSISWLQSMDQPEPLTQGSG